MGGGISPVVGQKRKLNLSIGADGRCSGWAIACSPLFDDGLRTSCVTKTPEASDVTSEQFTPGSERFERIAADISVH